jgi:phosphate-selective porin
MMSSDQWGSGTRLSRVVSSVAIVVGISGQAMAQPAEVPPPADVTPPPTPLAPSPAAQAPVPARVIVPAPATAPPIVVPAAVPPADTAPEPLAGVSDQSMFLRSPDNMFVFLPHGRLQVDSYFYKSRNEVPNDTVMLRRARLEVIGWIGGVAYFSIAGDFALAPPSTTPNPKTQAYVAATDNYVGLAPWGNIAMFQVGQFDAPFTLENRTSDKYFDFMERSLTVRAFGIPQNKETGGMLHGWDEQKHFFYSIGLFNGDGQNFKNVDEHFDWIGRAWLAPASFAGEGPLHDVEIGGSFWSGYRKYAGPPANQTTQGNLTFLNFAPYTTSMSSEVPNTTVGFRQFHRQNSFAFEINAPIAHRFGVRYEAVWKKVPLTADAIATNGTGTHLGHAELRGHSMYGEAWVWALGDDRIIGDQQGLEPIPRYKKFGVKPPQHGLMIAGRIEDLNERVSESADAAALELGSKVVGKTHVNSYELGVNYWYSKRFRATANYIFNYFQQHGSDTAPQIKALKSPAEHEIAFRIAVAL